MGCASSRQTVEDIEIHQRNMRMLNQYNRAIKNESYWRETNAVIIEGESTKENINNVIKELGI